MTICFVGNVKFSREMLKHLLSKDDNQIVGIITKENSNFNSDHSNLSDLALENKVPFKYVRDINSKENNKWIKDLHPDIIFCFGWSALLKKSTLNIPKLGVVGYHPSFLPKNRGRHPIIWALALGLKETGSTFFLMNEGVDTGKIINQKKVKIHQSDDASKLYDRIILVAKKQLDIILQNFNSKSIKFLDQSFEGNEWRKRGKEDGKIDFRMSSENIYNLVRALTKPYPGAHVSINDRDYKVWKCKIGEKYPNNIESGKILEFLENNVLVIKTGNGSILLLDHEIETSKLINYI